MPTWTLDSLELSPLEESAALLKLTLRAAQAGSWAWDILTGEALWSEELYLLVGATPETCPPTMESWLQTIHPEDRVGSLLEMERALAGNGDLHNEFRIVRPDGAVRRVRASGRTLHNREGRLLRMVGVCFDITEAKRTGISPRASEEGFRTALETLRDCLGKEGPGIGLALVKSIVEMHGGTVRAASGGPGQGSGFVVELPLRGEPAASTIT